MLIPQNKTFQQFNKGDVFGSLSASKNIDLESNEGVVRVSPKLTLSTKDNDSGITGLGIPHAFATHTISATERYWVACGIGATTSVNGTGKLLHTGSADPTSAFVNDTFGSTPTTIHADFSDMIEWANGNNAGANQGKSLFVSTFASSTSQIHQLFAATWNNTWYTTTVSGSFTVQGGIKNMCPAFNGRMYIIDDDLVIYVPPAAAAVLSGAGTLDFLGEYRPIWIRSSSDRLWISLMTFDKNIGTRGAIGMWDTTGTQLNKVIPINSPCALSGVVKDDVPYILDAFGVLRKFDGLAFKEIARLPVANLKNREMPGIYDDLTNNRWVHHRGMEVVDGKININVSNIDVDGNAVLEMPAGVWEYDEAHGLYHKNSPSFGSTDYGAFNVPTIGVGAIKSIGRSASGSLVGSKYFSDANTARIGLFYNDLIDNVQKYGYLITQQIFTENFEETWNKIGARFKKLLNINNKIWLKYRTEAVDPVEARITWVDTNTFTTPTDVRAYIGYEVEILQGDGAGKCSKIVSVATGASFTVVLAETFTGATTNTAKARFQFWKEVGTVTSQDVQSVKFTIDEPATVKIQLKVCLQFQGEDELFDLYLDSIKHE